MKPALPKGYRWLRRGQLITPRCKFFTTDTRRWVLTGWTKPHKLNALIVEVNGPYIAPIRKGRKRK